LTRFVWYLLAAALSTACVDNFDGSKIELLLNGGVDVPADPPGSGRPPSDTHYEIWIARDQSVFHITDFDIHTAISRSDPCFIEEEGSRFPGLHSTQIANKLIAVATAGGRTPTDEEAGEIAQAKVRVGNMTLLESSLKVFTAHEAGLTEAQITALTADVPTPDRTDDASNAERLAKCKAVWHDHPGYYVATDKVLAIPLNGTYYGLINGTDPRNGALVGGGSIDVGASFPVFDAMRIVWNWNDPNDARKDGFPPTSSGYYYMAGTPVMIVRGTINVSLVNQDFARIGGEASIYTNLGRDDVHF
jgi:hypothetical protein